MRELRQYERVFVRIWRKHGQQTVQRWIGWTLPG
jgi:hypothetical protein